jgi:anti-sigma regulatory factor (Ser/Thr protein kinase)
VITCLSELAANAVLHSASREPGATFTVRTEIIPGSHVRIEVTDQGSPWALPEASDEHGRGLQVVAGLASQWGSKTDPATHQRTMWAHLAWYPAATQEIHP